MRPWPPAPLLLVALGLAGLALLAPHARCAEGWHASLDDGLAAAAKSGRPLLVVTAWPDKV